MSQKHEPVAAPLDFMRLDNQLCFALYAAAHAITRAYRPLLEGMHLTYPQFLVMLALWESDGQTVSALGATLHLDSGTLSPVLKRLEKSGLIDKARLKSDERVVEVMLTGKGRALRSSGAAACITMRAQADLEQNNFEALRAELHRLTARLSHGRPMAAGRTSA